MRYTTQGGWWQDPARLVWEYRDARGRATNTLVNELVADMPREVIFPSLLRDMHFRDYHRKCHPLDCPLTSPKLGGP